MIVKRNFKNPVVHKMAENEFKDTSCADKIHMVYDRLDSIGLDLDGILSFLSSDESEEALYLLDKLRKVRKYMSGIAFRPGCYDSEGDYYGQSCNPGNGCTPDGYGILNPSDSNVLGAGGYPNTDCVITSE